MSEQFTLKRTGDAPLQFSGELLAESNGHWHKECNRWHDLAVYRTDGGKYIMRIAYRTIWQGESDFYQADYSTTLDGITSELRCYDPTEHVGGFPAGEQYAERQAKLLEGIRRRWAGQVAEVLNEIGAVEEID